MPYLIALYFTIAGYSLAVSRRKIAENLDSYAHPGWQVFAGAMAALWPIEFCLSLGAAGAVGTLPGCGAAARGIPSPRGIPSASGADGRCRRAATRLRIPVVPASRER